MLFWKYELIVGNIILWLQNLILVSKLIIKRFENVIHNLPMSHKEPIMP